MLRFFPIWFGLPYAQARPDETAALGLAVSIRSGDLNPHFFHWPSFALYVFAGVHAVLSWTRRVMDVSQELTFIELALGVRGRSISLDGAGLPDRFPAIIEADRSKYESKGRDDD